VEFPSHLLDELARVFARAALDRLLRDAMEAMSREGTGIESDRHEKQEPGDGENPPCEG
jgi:hypothetical protein